MKRFLKFFLVLTVGIAVGVWVMHKIDKWRKYKPEIDSEVDDEDYYEDDGLDYSDLGLDEEPPKVEVEVIERDEKEVADSIKTPSEKLTEDDIFNLSEEELKEGKS